jgi:hypothetical protein
MNDKRERDDPFKRLSDKFGKETASAGEGVRSGLGDAADAIKDQARNAAEEQKAAGADHLSGLGNAVHSAAGELEKEIPQTAHFIHSAAESLENASTALRERSIEDLVESFNRFARNQPAAAFAGSVLAGFALSRFLKSSATQPQHGGGHEI